VYRRSGGSGQTCAASSTHACNTAHTHAGVAASAQPAAQARSGLPATRCRPCAPPARSPQSQSCTTQCCCWCCRTCRCGSVAVGRKQQRATAELLRHEDAATNILCTTYICQPHAGFCVPSVVDVLRCVLQATACAAQLSGNRGNSPVQGVGRGRHLSIRQVELLAQPLHDAAPACSTRSAGAARGCGQERSRQHLSRAKQEVPAANCHPTARRPSSYPPACRQK
jgi:hypothetical protein